MITSANDSFTPASGLPLPSRFQIGDPVTVQGTVGEVSGVFFEKDKVWYQVSGENLPEDTPWWLSDDVHPHILVTSTPPKDEHET